MSKFEARDSEVEAAYLAIHHGDVRAARRHRERDGAKGQIANAARLAIEWEHNQGQVEPEPPQTERPDGLPE